MYHGLVYNNIMASTRNNQRHHHTLSTQRWDEYVTNLVGNISKSKFSTPTYLPLFIHKEFSNISAKPFPLKILEIGTLFVREFITRPQR
jgi:hypothetical protein